MNIKKKVLPKFCKYDINAGGAEYKDGLGWTEIFFRNIKQLNILYTFPIFNNKITTLIVEVTQNYITNILLFGPIFTQIYKKKC